MPEKRRIRWLAVVSGCCLVFIGGLLLTRLFPTEFDTSRPAGWSLGGGVRVGAFDRGLSVWSGRPGPYTGSVLALSDGPTLYPKVNGLDIPGLLYYRGIEMAPGDVWRTFTFSRLWLAVPLAMPPAAWVLLRIRRRPGVKLVFRGRRTHYE